MRSGDYYADDQLAISGTASDATSGLRYIRYTIDASNDGLNNETPATIAGTAVWVKNDIASDGILEGTTGTSPVWLQIEDMAGNVSAWTPYTYSVDHGAPDLTVDAAFDGIVFTNDDPFTINGTTSDVNFGAGTPITITAKKNGVSYDITGTTTTYTDEDPDPDTWSRAIDIDESASYEITITSTDKFNRATVEKRTVNVDQTEPAVIITSFSKYATGSKVNGNVTFNSIASDANGLEDLLDADGVRYFITDATYDDNAPAYDATEATAGVVNILEEAAGQSIDTTDTGEYADGSTYYLWAVARDKAGNDGHNGAAVSFQIDQSTDRPVVTCDSLIDNTVLLQAVREITCWSPARRSAA